MGVGGIDEMASRHEHMIHMRQDRGETSVDTPKGIRGILR